MLRIHTVGTLLGTAPVSRTFPGKIISPKKEDASKDTNNKKWTFASYFFSRPSGIFDWFKRLTGGAIVALSAGLTPPLYIALNEIALNRDLIPNGSVSRDLETSRYFTNQANKRFIIDGFANNFNGFNNVLDLLNQEQIDLSLLDGSTNRILFNNSSDFDKLIEILSTRLKETSDTNKINKYNEAIKTLNDCKILYGIVWGRNRLDPNTIYQYENECNIAAAVIGASLNDKNTNRFLKSNVKILEYDLSRKELILSFGVNVNGKTIKVHHLEINQFSENNKFKAPLGPIAITIAIERELGTNYIPNPYNPLCASNTLLTGESYYNIPVRSLSQQSLIGIIKKAPNTLITVGTYPRIDEYIGDTQSRFAPITESGLFRAHAYTIKGWKEENGIFKVIVKDSNDEKELTIDQFQNEVLYIAAPSRTVPFFDLRTLLLLSASVSYIAGATLLAKKSKA